MIEPTTRMPLLTPAQLGGSSAPTRRSARAARVELWDEGGGRREVARAPAQQRHETPPPRVPPERDGRPGGVAFGQMLAATSSRGSPSTPTTSAARRGGAREGLKTNAKLASLGLWKNPSATTAPSPSPKRCASTPPQSWRLHAAASPPTGPRTSTPSCEHALEPRPRQQDWRRRRPRGREVAAGHPQSRSPRSAPRRHHGRRRSGADVVWPRRRPPHRPRLARQHHLPRRVRRRPLGSCLHIQWDGPDGQSISNKNEVSQNSPRWPRLCGRGTSAAAAAGGLAAAAHQVGERVLPPR